jgi:hypothetical protein
MVSAAEAALAQASTATPSVFNAGGLPSGFLDQ